MKKESFRHHLEDLKDCEDDMFMDSDMPDCCKQGDMEYDCKDMQLAHAYVPWQNYCQAFSPCEALRKGTLFPELYGVYPIPQ